MTDPLQCLTCGAVVMGGTQFCGQCGADFAKAPALQRTAILKTPRQAPLVTAAIILQRVIYVACGGALLLIAANVVWFSVFPAEPHDPANTVWLRACSSCGGRGEIGSGIRGFSPAKCSACFGTGSVLDHIGGGGSDHLVPISRQTWDKMVEDRDR